MIRMRFVLLFVIALLSYFPGSAQDVTYSSPEKFDIHNGDFSVVGRTNSRLFTYIGSSDGFFLYIYNDSMERVATVVLDFFQKKIYETRFIAYSNKIIVLYQSVEGNKVVQYAALLDETGRLKKGPIQIAEAKTGIFGPTRSYFSSAVSEDKKTIVVYSAGEKGEQMEFDGKWMDDELNITHRNHASYKADNDISHADAIVSNEGVLYIPVFMPIGAKEYTDQCWLLSMPLQGGKFIAKELPLEGKFGANIYCKLDNLSQHLYFGGFYSDKKNGNYEGVLFAYYDIATGTYMNKRLLPFNDQMLNATGEASKKRAFNDFQVRQLILKNDGGFVLIAENAFVTTRSSYAPGWGYYSFYSPSMSTSVREYHYNDVWALSYSSDGGKLWDAFVRKNQYSQEDGGRFSSYALLNSGGTLAFLYNDFNTARSRIQLATLDGDGKINMRSFTTDNATDPDWLPRSGKQVSAKEMIVPCLRKKQICFAKIVF